MIMVIFRIALQWRADHVKHDYRYGLLRISILHLTKLILMFTFIRVRIVYGEQTKCCRIF
jgi:hypothetical protein